MRYAIDNSLTTLRDAGSQAVTLITEEGFVAKIYHNGCGIEALLFDYKKANRYEFTDSLWNTLKAEGFSVLTFKEGDDVARDVAFRLCLFCPSYELVEWNELVTDYNDKRDWDEYYNYKLKQDDQTQRDY